MARRLFGRVRRDGDRGATMLEFAMVVPLLALLAFGTAEMGLAWTANNRVEGAVSSTARVGASIGRDVNADVNILLALRTALPAESLANLDRVVIFKPATADGGVPSGCVPAMGSATQAGAPGSCNSYSGNTVRTFNPAAADPLLLADNQWLGDQRNDSLADPPDYIGVYVRTRHTSKTGAFFTAITITRTSIYRIQPDIDG